MIGKRRAELEEAEAVKYAELIRGPFRADWAAINADIVARFSLTALHRIKTRAWRIVEGGK